MCNNFWVSVDTNGIVMVFTEMYSYSHLKIKLESQYVIGFMKKT